MAYNRRDRWKPKVQRDRQLSAGARLFLVAVLAPKMNAAGIVSVPREQLATLAGVSERQVTNYISAAHDGGWLMTIQPGHRGMTAVYQASIPSPNSGKASSPFKALESGNSTNPLSGGTAVPPLSARKREVCVPTIGSSRTTTPRGRRDERHSSAGDSGTVVGAQRHDVMNDLDLVHSSKPSPLRVVS